VLLLVDAESDRKNEINGDREWHIDITILLLLPTQRCANPSQNNVPVCIFTYILGSEKIHYYTRSIIISTNFYVNWTKKIIL